MNLGLLQTLTVPNIKRENLSSEIDKMNKVFIKFWEWLYKPFKVYVVIISYFTNIFNNIKY